MRPLSAFLTLMIALVLLGCASGVTAEPARNLPEPEGEWRPVDCRFWVPTTLEVTCGDFFVPEVYTQSEGRRIALHVAIVGSDETPDGTTPLVFLAGGPGSHALDLLAYLDNQWGTILRTRDLIVLDPRGVGHSIPSLDCYETDGLRRAAFEKGLSLEAERAEMHEALTRCRDRLDERSDLSAYHSAAMAADLEALRRALGYGAWNLYGVSYGSRVALTAMRDYPEGIRSVVLDSPLPLQVDLPTAWAPGMAANFDRLYAACADDEACHARFPTLEADIAETVARLDAEPLELQFYVRGEQSLSTAAIDGRRLLEILTEAFYDDSRLPYIPLLIDEIDRGSTIRLADWIEIGIGGEEYWSEGQYLSVVCREEIPFSAYDSTSPERSDDAMLSRLEQVGGMASTIENCRRWGTEPAGQIESQPVRSDIPTLILSGEFSHASVLEWPNLIEQGIDRVYSYKIPGVGAGILGTRRCATEMTRDFLAAPDEPPDDMCLQKLRTFFFVR